MKGDDMEIGLRSDLIFVWAKLESGTITRQGYRLSLDRIGDRYDLDIWEVRDAMHEARASHYDEIMDELYSLWSNTIDGCVTHGDYERCMREISDWYIVSEADLYYFMQEVRESLQGPVL